MLITIIYELIVISGDKGPNVYFVLSAVNSNF